MPQFNRFNGDVLPFASSATGTNRTVFGDVTQSDDIDDNLNSFFKTGWEIVGPNEAPTKQDFNAMAYTNSLLAAYLYQQGIPEWNALQTFYTGNISIAASGAIVRSKSDSNIGNNPDTDSGTNWEAAIFTGLKNKIINGLLSSAINQRVAASIIATPNAYNYDRWFYDGTYLYYGVEEPDIYDGTFTLSWLSDATAEYQLITTATASSGLSAITTGWTAVSNGGNFTLTGTTGNHLWLRFTVGLDGFPALDKVQLEEGSVATPFEHRPYGLELALCRRYYEKIINVESNGEASGAVARAASETIYWKTRKRVTPAVNFTYASIENLQTSPTPPAVDANDKDHIMISFGAASAGRFRVIFNTVVADAEL